MLRVPAGGSMPLSNVKRLFRSRFNMELSETALGHSKLSELLNDTRLQDRDICFVRLQGHGYVVAHPHQRARCISLSSSIAGGAAPTVPLEEEGSLHVTFGDPAPGAPRRAAPPKEEGSLRVTFGGPAPDASQSAAPPASEPRTFEIKIRNTFVHVDDEPSACTPANKDLARPKRAKTAPAPEALDPGPSDDEGDDEDSVAGIPSKPAADDNEDNVSDRSQGDGPDCCDSCSTGTGGETRMQAAGGCDEAASASGACAGDPPEAQ
ncbi:unnamed protein product, partial [Prorocentrum cordatum]